MTVYHIPKAILERHHPLPEFAPVEPVEDAYALPQPGISEPIHVQALRGTLPADTCNACGHPVALHYDTSGILYVGCQGVASRLALRTMTDRPLRDVITYGDAHPVVSAAIRDALRVGCGVDVAQWFEGLRHDERINLSRRLAEISAIALRMEDAR